MKRLDDLTPEERKMILDDIKSGKLDLKTLTSDVWFVTDQTDAFNELTETRRRQMSGEDITVLFVGPCREFLKMTNIVDEMIIGEQNEKEYPYFEQDRFGIWKHIDKDRVNLHMIVPFPEDENN